MVMQNKRGQDLSIGTLILIVLGIVVLVLLILGFSLGWQNLWEKINIFGGTSSKGDIVTACRLAHTSNDQFTLCERTWDITIDGEEIRDYSCRAAKNEGLLNINLNCGEPEEVNFDYIVTDAESCIANSGSPTVDSNCNEEVTTNLVCCQIER